MATSLLLTLLSASGCGGGSSGGGAGSGGDGGSGGDEGSGGSGDPSAECAMYASSGAPEFVAVRIVNQSASSIWVDTGCSVPFGLRIDGQSVEPFLSFPSPTCNAIQNGSPPCCDCFPTQQEILPGADYHKNWAQVFHEKVDMPLTCVPEALQPNYNGCYISHPIPSQGLEMVGEIRRCLDDSCPASEEVSAPFVAGQDPIDINVP